MAWMGGWFDPELEDLFQNEPELLETAQQACAPHARQSPSPIRASRTGFALSSSPRRRAASAPAACAGGGVSDRRTSRGAGRWSVRL